jgi:hypothetical protein
MPRGWIQGKPVTALMRQLMQEARDEGAVVVEGAREFYASLILCRWGWLESTPVGDGTHIIRLTRFGRNVLDGELAERDGAG